MKPKVVNLSPLYNFIQEKYKVGSAQAKKVVHLASKNAHKEFPNAYDILAIMSIESTFKSNAISTSKAKGLMQVKYKKTNSDEENVLAGVELLIEYRKKLNTEKAAIIAYNVGITNYKKGIRNTKYYNKFLKERELLKNIAMQ